MIVSATFKMPDADTDAVEDLDEDEKDEALEKLATWIKHGEYVTIDFDLDAMTAKVRTVK